MATINTAPLLDRMRTKGGTVYTLSGTTKDFSYLFGENDINMIPSKFVALKLPNWANVSNQHMFIDAAENGLPLITDANYTFPKALQNYSENLIQYSDANRNDTTLYNYNEQSIWKLLRKLGALSLIPSGNTIVENGVTKVLYKEQVKSATYDPIIKFVGDVNLLNHTKRNGVEYNETFLHIPTDAGRMDDVLFKKTDVSHTSGLIPSGGGTDITQGLVSFDGIKSVKAIYDNTLTKQYSVGSDIEDCGVYFDDIKTETSKHNKGDFEFNAILLYYDIYSQSDATKKATNAYGLIMLNQFETVTSGTANVDTFKKYQPDSVQPGNAFAEKLMLKFGSYSHQTTSEITINSFSTVSMEMYMEALKRLTNVQSDYDVLRKDNITAQATINNLKQMLSNYDTLNDSVALINGMNDRLKLIETASSNGNIRISNEDIFKLLQTTMSGFSTNITPLTQNITVSSKTLLPKVIDTANLIVADDADQRYQWDVDKWITL